MLLYVNVKCPTCGTRLDVWEEFYYDNDGDKDSAIEFECPRGCTYDDEQVDQLQERVEREAYKLEQWAQAEHWMRNRPEPSPYQMIRIAWLIIIIMITAVTILVLGGD